MSDIEKQFDEFIDGADEADIEDMFEEEEYLDLFNSAFHEHKDLSLGDLEANMPRIVLRISKTLGIARFNHYRPALQCLRSGTSFSDEALTRFEAAFKKVNGLM